MPEEIEKGLAHLEQLTAARPSAPQPGRVAADLAQHIGNPAAMDKALKAAALALASADAAAKIHGHLAETCGARIRGMMRTRSEEVCTSFGVALDGDLRTLEATAGRLPAWFNPEQAASLNREDFTAWTQARDAYSGIQTASLAVAPLYSGAIGHDDAIHFPDAAAASLRLAELPALRTTRQSYAIRAALAGRAERVQGVAGQGSTFVDGLFIATVLSHAGATFKWATPSEVTQRSERLVAGMVARRARRRSPRDGGGEGPRTPTPQPPPRHRAFSHTEMSAQWRVRALCGSKPVFVDRLFRRGAPGAQPGCTPTSFPMQAH